MYRLYLPSKSCSIIWDQLSRINPQDAVFKVAAATAAIFTAGTWHGIPYGAATPFDALQGVIAPFMLENINCTGSEERLVDCPAVARIPFYEYSPEDYTYEFTYGGDTPNFCNFFEGSFAFVACGATSGPGVAAPTRHACVRTRGGMRDCTRPKQVGIMVCIVEQPARSHMSTLIMRKCTFPTRSGPMSGQLLGMETGT